MEPLWRAVFGNGHPVEIEIGPGNGAFLLAAAARCPERNFFAIEHSRKRARQLRALLQTRAHSNVSLLVADAACVVTTLIPPRSVAAYHIYFPDPWWKRRHHRRRLFTPEFAAALSRTLVADGRVYLATDVDMVFAFMLSALTAEASLRHDASARPPRLIVTSFERKGLLRGARISEATFIKNGCDESHTSSAAPITPAESPS